MSPVYDDDIEARILDIGAALLAETEGALSLGEVARRAGVSRGTIYRRFGNREGFLARLRAEREVDPGASTSTRNRILDAVAELIGSRGPSATTLEMVAERAQVSMMSIYRHFGDKAGLLRTFMDERSLRSSLAALTPAGGPGEEADIEATLTGFLADAVEFAAHNPALVATRLMPDSEDAAVMAEIEDKSLSGRVALARFFTQQIECGRLSPEHSPRSMVAIVFGAVLGFVNLDRERALREPLAIATTIARTVLHGWLSPAESGGTPGQQAP